MHTTDNFRKHKSKSKIQQYLLSNFNKILQDEVAALKPVRILDVGCGEGFTLERLRKARIGRYLEGVDSLDLAIKLGRKEHPNLILKKGSIYELKFQDDSFDLVLCSEVLEHVENPEKALLELVRVSKRYVVLSVPNEPFFMLGNLLRGKNISRLGNDIEHINHWTFWQFRKFVAKKLKIRRCLSPIPWTLIVAEKI